MVGLAQPDDEADGGAGKGRQLLSAAATQRAFETSGSSGMKPMRQVTELADSLCDWLA